MSYKRTLPDGMDYAVPSRKPPFPPPPPPPKPMPPVPPCPPPPAPPAPPVDWAVYPYFPPYQEEIEPVVTPPIPGRPIIPPPPPFPPYPFPPKPEKTDECSRRLAQLSGKAKVLVQMIKDFEQKNKPAILTIGNHSYQFGTENIIDFSGEPGKGMYSTLICGEPIQELVPKDCDIDDSGTRVAVRDPVDLLQTELARVRLEITLVAMKLNDEVSGESGSGGSSLVPGTDEQH